MLIVVTDNVRLDEVENLQEFSVLSSLTPAQVGARLEAAKLGRADATHAWIDVEALRAQAITLAQDPCWSANFDGMVAYAGDKGWWDEASNAIRAHISTPS